MAFVRCRRCRARRTLPRFPEEYTRKPPRCRTAGCKSHDYREDKYRARVERGKGSLRMLCYPGRGGCDGYTFPHRKGSGHCMHNPNLEAFESEDHQCSCPF